MTDQNQTRDQRFNFNGVVANLKQGKTGEGDSWVSFKLEREGKKRLTVGGFGKHADAFLADFKQGDTVKVFGYFKTKSFVPAGQTETVTYQQFELLWTGVPAAQQAESSEDAPAAESQPAPAAEEPKAEAPKAEQVDPEVAKYQAMTKAQLVAYAGEFHGEDLNANHNKDALIAQVIELDRQAVGEAA